MPRKRTWDVLKVKVDGSEAWLNGKKIVGPILSIKVEEGVIKEVVSPMVLPAEPMPPTGQTRGD